MTDSEYGSELLQWQIRGVCKTDPVAAYNFAMDRKVKQVVDQIFVEVMADAGLAVGRDNSLNILDILRGVADRIKAEVGSKPKKVSNHRRG